MEVHRIGFTALSCDTASDQRYRINVIFVHGLRGHPKRTWGRGSDHSNDAGPTNTTTKRSLKALFQRDRQASGSAAPSRPFWPYEFLQDDAPEARIWTYGYNADVVDVAFQAQSKNSISQHGRDLAVQFERDIGNEDPVLFIAHSLGGIVVKDAIRRSKICRSQTKLIVFLGTPHRGSPYVEWAGIAMNLARLALRDANKKVVETLAVDSEVLENIHEEFCTIVYESGIKIHSFQEARPPSGVKGLQGKVVDDHSSRLGLPRAIETVESIDADHGQMTKFARKEDPGYRAIFGVVKQFIRSHSQIEVSGSASLFSTTPVVGQQIEDVTAQFKTVTVAQESSEAFFNVPFGLNPRFVGRATLLQRLQVSFFASQGYQKVALVGLGGIGKTQTALQFAFWIRENKPEYSVFWVPALSRATFEQAYLEIKNICALRGAEGEDPKELVRQYLSSEAAGKWILIVDNADDLEILRGSTNNQSDLYRFLPQSNEGGILFTTRSQKVAVSVATSNVLDVPEMERDEAVKYLEKSLIDKDLLRDQQAVDELLGLLTCLPLAITQAAAYLNENFITISEYLRLFENTDQDMVELLSSEYHDDTRYQDSQNAVAKTWFISFQHIGQVDEFAERLLLFISCIEPKNISRALLPDGPSKQRQTQAIGTLCGYKFLYRRDGSETFDMHSLVHVATRMWLERQSARDGVRETRELVISHIAQVFPSDDWEKRYLWRQYLPHGLKAIHKADTTLSEDGCQLMFWMGRCLRLDGRHRESLGILIPLVIRETALPEEHLDRLASQHELARAYRANGQIGEALKLLEHVVRIRETVLAEDHPDRLASQHELARAYRANGQIEKALKLLEHVVRISETVLAEDHSDRLASQLVLAGAYLANGQIEKALKLLEHVVRIRETVLAEDHPDRLASQLVLAGAYRANGQIGEALKLLEHVVRIRETVLAEDHPDRLTSQHELARAYRANGQIEKALKLLEHVVRIRETVLAEDHPDRLVSQHELAGAYRANGQIGEALKLLEHVVRISETVLAEDHPNRLASQHELARAYRANGQIEEALKLLEHVVRISETVLAEDHPDRLASQLVLATAYQSNGQAKDAIELLEHVATIQKISLAEDHPDRIVTEEWLEYVRAGFKASE
ncbi:hypothetical protein EDB81DRAFT_687534 [Dactylonectria macrodidyma]|uniref:NB-ARC domain-containing protein n=1 Tax=Dactylonectria macrodidyma TaxID=307937 RepID=A0A9P9J8G0_9HYPO|nr:hypothetical protein EDB81DRAFT_687534 [Dactylonectria macrodidyma]